MRIKNNITNSYPIAFHLNGGFKKCKIGYNLFAGETMNTWNWDSSEKLRHDVTLCFAKWGDESKFICTLDENLQRFNLRYLNIGKNFDPPSHGEIRTIKPHLLHENLNQITTKYVVGWDVDVFFTEHPNRIVERFENEFECDWLFNAENKVFPAGRHLTGSANPIYWRWPEHQNIIRNQTPFMYLNSGLFICKVDFFKEIFSDIISTRLLKDKADQGQFQQIYRKYYPRMQIDNYCKIFQSLNGLQKDNLKIEK